jgi:hypothetical protein
MPVYPALYETDGVTPASDAIPTVSRGAATEPEPLRLYNDVGSANPDAEPLEDGYLKAVSWNGEQWVDHGIPALDDRMVRVSLTDPSTGTAALGTFSTLPLPPIGQGEFVEFEWWLEAPADASDDAPLIQLIVVYDERSTPLAQGVTLSSRGVLPSYRDEAARRIVEGGEVTADGSDAVSVAAIVAAFDGAEYATIAEDLTLNQTDGDASALASGESYLALVTLPAGGPLTVTKGSKSDGTPVAPDAPADSAHVALVTVAHDAGGSSIDQNDVDQTALIRGDYYAEPGAGFSVRVHSGVSYTGDTRQAKTVIDEVSVDSEATSYIWVRVDGTLDVTVSETPPAPDALLIWEATADDSAITDLIDRRPMLHLGEHVEVIRYSDSFGTAGTPRLIGSALLPFEADLLAVSLDVSGLDPEWASGEIKIDIESVAPGVDVGDASAESIYTSAATEDLRPAIAWDAATLHTKSRFHETRRFPAWTRFAVRLVEVPDRSGATADEVRDLWVTLTFAKR